MSSGSIRIIQLPEKSSVNTDDYMAVDSSANGTKKVKFTDLLDDNLSAQNKAADAQATGEAINDISARVDNMINTQQNASVTTLWTGTLNTKNQSVTLSESIVNFDFIDVYCGGIESTFIRKPVANSIAFQLQQQNMSDNASAQFMNWFEETLSISGTTATITKCISCRWDDFSQVPVVSQDTEGIEIIRIDGVKIGHVENDEVIDARVGANGTTYPTLGDAIRGQVTDLENEINKLIVEEPLDIFEAGGLSSSTGNKISGNNKRLRTNGYLGNGIIKARALADYEFLVYAYSNGTYVGCLQTDGTWAKASSVKYVASFTFTHEYDYKLVLRKTDDSEIDIGESVNILFGYATDETLTLQHKSADAKVVGTEIRRIDKNVSDMLIALSSGDSEVDITSINGISTFAIGAINGSGADTTSSTSYRTDYFIPVNEYMFIRSELALIGATSSTAYHYIAFYDESHTFLSRAGGTYASYSTINASVPTGAKYCRISLTYVEIGNVQNYNFTTFYNLPTRISPKNKWYVLGDSISAGYYSMTQSMAEEAGVTFDYTSPVTTDGGEATGSVWDRSLSHNYWGYANKWYLMRELVGKAYPGQGYYRTASNDQNGVYVVDNNDFSDAGLITVAWGFNDWHYNQPRGNHNLIDSNVPIPTDNYDTSQITTVNHAIWYCLGRLIKNAPKAKIVVQTPMNGWAYGGDFSTNWSIGYAKSQSDTLKDIHDDIIYWCDYYGLQYIDMTFNNSIINRVNIKDTIIDGSHPSDDAHKQLARTVWTKIGY